MRFRLCTLSEALLLETFIEAVNADPTLLPNTTLRGLALSEGASDSGFMDAVDYAHFEGACVTYGVVANYKQDRMGPVRRQGASSLAGKGWGVASVSGAAELPAHRDGACV